MYRRVDGFLSLQAQKAYPDAIVYCQPVESGENWTMERPGQEPLGLGSDFKQARIAIYALRNASIVAKGREIKAEREKEGESK